MDPNKLLIELATDLWDQVHRYAPAVLREQSPSAAPAPFGPFIYAQRASHPDAYHLPEPILHPVGSPSVLVVGLNPGYGPSEMMPHLGTPLSDYVAWYASRFEQARRDQRGRPLAVYREGGKELARPVKHYVKIEALLEPALGPHALGRSAVYADAIPWKWNNSVEHVRPQLSMAAWEAVWQSVRVRISTILEGLRPHLVLTLGLEPAARIFRSRPSDLPRSSTASLDRWTGLHLPISHPNARGKTRVYWEAVAREIARAVDLERG